MAQGKHDWPMFVSKKKEKMQMIYYAASVEQDE